MPNLRPCYYSSFVWVDMLHHVRYPIKTTNGHVVAIFKNLDWRRLCCDLGSTLWLVSKFYLIANMCFVIYRVFYLEKRPVGVPHEMNYSALSQNWCLRKNGDRSLGVDCMHYLAFWKVDWILLQDAHSPIGIYHIYFGKDTRCHVLWCPELKSKATHEKSLRY